MSPCILIHSFLESRSVIDIPLNIYCAPKELYIQAYKHVAGLPLDSNDRICSKNGMCVMFDSYHNFDTKIILLFDLKSEIIIMNSL